MKCPSCGKQHLSGGKFCRHCGTLVSSTTAGPPSAGGTGLGFGPSRFGARPHRGGMILTFGILGLALCVILGVVAWIMGRSDLDEMRTGTMDSSGEGLTRAGMICGIVSVVLTVGTLVLWIVVFGWAFATV
jgi:hypothetical protein